MIVITNVVRGNRERKPNSMAATAARGEGFAFDAGDLVIQCMFLVVHIVDSRSGNLLSGREIISHFVRLSGG